RRRTPDHSRRRPRPAAPPAYHARRRRVPAPRADGRQFRAPRRRYGNLKLFSMFYERALLWARHRHAERYLVALSFAESSFFPIPPDVMLAPMTLAEPRRGWRLAFATTLGSVVGGIAGYAIGWFAFDAVQPWLVELGYWDGYERATQWF